MEEIKFVTLKDYLGSIESATRDWARHGMFTPWFRGQPDGSKPPLPSVLRDDYQQSEFQLTTSFRNRAVGYGAALERDPLDKWLFLMQHVGLPTRLLDWTESPLMALYFALDERIQSGKLCDGCPAVWAIDPLQLNKLSGMDFFPNTWVPGPTLENFKIAFGTAGWYQSADGKWHKPTLHKPTEFPLAVQAQSVHYRVNAQKSCFTIHGEDSRDFEAMLSGKPQMEHFAKLICANEDFECLLDKLNELGISASTVSPDLDGLAKDLKFRLRP